MECAAEQQGDKSFLMNVPTRQCLRKRKRDKTEPSFQQHNVSARKTKDGSIAEGHKDRGGISSPLLGLQPRAFAQGCKLQTTHCLCCRRFVAIDPTDVNSSMSPASSQNSCVFKTRSSNPSAPHPVADIVSAPHLIDIVSFVTWLVCRKRTAALDPKRMHMRALYDCAPAMLCVVLIFCIDRCPAATRS